MKHAFRAILIVCGLLFILPGNIGHAAQQAGKSTYIVAPFAIQGPAQYNYLERSLPQMLTSRLYWKDRLEPVRGELAANVKVVASDADADKLRQQYKADYVVWGTVTIVNDNCSVDVRVRDAGGTKWAAARETRAPQLIAAVTGISDSINSEVFGRAPTARTATRSAQNDGPINRMNPDIMVNETSPREVYLNPQFRYSGSSTQDDSRLRSQALNFPAIGMEVADIDGDGRNEILILEDTKLHAFSFGSGKMDPKGSFAFPLNSQCLTVRSLPRASGRPWIIVTAIDSKGVPNSSILTYSGSGFKEEMKNIKWYLNVVKLPPEFLPILVGQESAQPQLFRPGVFEMIKSGDGLTTGRKVNLPSEANVFNFSWMPPSRGEQNSEKLLVLNSNEQIRVYGHKLARLASTSEAYSGSAIGMEVNPSMPGMSRETVTIGRTFYIPMRMLPVDLENDGTYKVIVNKPISTASQIFDRYRFFPQSEIHCLFWDGIGLNLQWKTRRIKGSMVDYTLADANNDGILDLVCCVNTHPGALGVKARRGMVLLYPLDTAQIAPITPDKSEVYE
ncbi:VCBS repeat-containing protein [Desulfovibrio sp. OttesenSCG-928-M16]|nr:VCBS repeat-containing protein [Desulfovibrio sp. OttesenSCG-928-M16]